MEAGGGHCSSKYLTSNLQRESLWGTPKLNHAGSQKSSFAEDHGI